MVLAALSVIDSREVVLTPLDVSILLMSPAGRAALAEIKALESELAQVGWQLDAARRVIDGVIAADVSFITLDTATVTLAHAGDAIAWCAHLIEAGGCDGDVDFVATDDTVTVTMPAVAGRQHLGVVVRDRALLQAALTHGR